MGESQRFDDRGYTTVPRLFSPSEIGTLSRIVDRIFRQWLVENQSASIEHRLVNMHSLTSPRYFSECPEERLLLFRMLASTALMNLLDGMFGEGLYFHNTQLFFNPLGSGKTPYWHRDLQYSPIDDAALEAAHRNLLALHVRIPLVAETGIELISGTHKRWDTELERKVRLELDGHRNDEAIPGAVLIGLQPGDVLIFSAQMIHRGNYRLNESRKALDLCVGKHHPYTARYLDESVLPTVDELDRIPNDRWYRAAWSIARARTPD